jgi:hypothetical protein
MPILLPPPEFTRVLQCEPRADEGGRTPGDGLLGTDSGVRPQESVPVLHPRSDPSTRGPNQEG